MKEAKYSKYFWKHLMFYYEPGVLILPIAFYINEDAIQISSLWFHMVWYWKKQNN